MSPVSDRQRASNSHQYKDPRSGEKPPYSVTSIVGNYAEPGKIDRMAYAAAKIGIKFREQWNESGARGTRVHKNICDWVEGRTTDVLDSDHPYVDAVAKFVRATRPAWLQSERDVIGDGYGGRLDLIGELHHPRRRYEGVLLPEDCSGFWSIDTKTGKFYRSPLELQLGGYMGAVGMVVYDDKGTAVDLEPLPYVTRWGGLYLAEDGTAALVEVAPTEQDKKLAIAAFQAQLAVRRWADGLES